MEAHNAAVMPLFPPHTPCQDSVRAALAAKLHNRTDKFRRDHDFCCDNRFLHIVNLRGSGRFDGLVSSIISPFCLVNLIDERPAPSSQGQDCTRASRRSLYDFQGAAALKIRTSETKAQRDGGLRLIEQSDASFNCRFFQYVPQIQDTLRRLRDKVRNTPWRAAPSL